MKTKLFLICAMISTLAFAGDGTSLSGSLIIYPQLSYVKTQGMTTVTAGFPKQLVNSQITNGTNDNQMSEFSIISGTVLGGETNYYDLQNMTNIFGDAADLLKVNFLAVTASATNSSDIVMSGDSGNYDATVRPGGTVLLFAPNDGGYVSCGGACGINILNTGTNSASFDIYIGGN